MSEVVDDEAPLRTDCCTSVPAHPQNGRGCTGNDGQQSVSATVLFENNRKNGPFETVALVASDDDTTVVSRAEVSSQLDVIEQNSIGKRCYTLEIRIAPSTIRRYAVEGYERYT